MASQRDQCTRHAAGLAAGRGPEPGRALRRDPAQHSRAVRNGLGGRGGAGREAVGDSGRQRNGSAPVPGRQPPLPARRIVTVPNGVDGERRTGGDRAAVRGWLGLTDEYLFVSLARHCLQKNSYGLVAAFGEAARRRPEAHLVIAGQLQDLRYHRKVLQLRDSLPCRDRIHLRDHAAAPGELLAAADGFVMDSFYEAWSLASMEALYIGVPVVLSDVGGAREQVGDDPARGYVVANPLGDPLEVGWEAMAKMQYRPQVNREELAAAMDHLINGRRGGLGGPQTAGP